MDVNVQQFDLELFEKILILMKKYGVEKLSHLHYNISMKCEPGAPAPAPMYEGSLSENLFVMTEAAKEKFEKFNEKYKATDEEILFNPYYGLPDENLSTHPNKDYEMEAKKEMDQAKEIKE